METTGQKTALDLHQLSVDGTDQGIAPFQVDGRGVVFGQVDILIEVALTRRLNDGVDDLNAAATFTQLLVGTNKLTQLLQTPVEACIFSRWGEVADGRGVATTLGDGGFRGVIGGVVIEVWEGTDQ